MLNQQLINYVSESISSGISKDEVIKILLDVGWSKKDVDDAFDINEKRDVDKKDGPTHFDAANTFQGDGSWITSYDLGLPGEKISKEVKMPSETVKTESDEDITNKADERKSEKQTQSILPESKVTDDIEKSNSGTSLRALFLIGAVFIFFGIMGFILWWFVNKNDVAVRRDDESLNRIDSKLNTQEMNVFDNDEQIIYERPLLLGDLPYVSTSGFQINYPEDWTIDDDGTFDTLVIFSNPNVDEEIGNKYSANINVVFEQDSEMNYEEYVESSRQILKENFPTYNEISKKDLLINESDVVILEGQYEVGAYFLHNIQLIVKTGNGFYVVTGTTLDNKWEIYKEVLEKSILSFSW